MYPRRWKIPVIASVVVLTLATVVVVSFTHDESFEPGTDGYLKLACGLHRHQRELSRTVIEERDTERQLGYAISSLFLEVGNRELNTRLQDLSDDLKAGFDNDDDRIFDQARVRADAECDGYGRFTPDPDELVEIACSISGEMGTGPGPEVLITALLVGSAAAQNQTYQGLAKAASQLVIDPKAPMDSNHPGKEDIAAFRKQCP